MSVEVGVKDARCWEHALSAVLTASAVVCLQGQLTRVLVFREAVIHFVAPVNIYGDKEDDKFKIFYMKSQNYLSRFGQICIYFRRALQPFCSSQIRVDSKKLGLWLHPLPEIRNAEILKGIFN